MDREKLYIFTDGHFSWLITRGGKSIFLPLNLDGKG
jgi:hypothetical protein